MLPCAGKHSHAGGVAGIPAKAYIEIRAVGPTLIKKEKQISSYIKKFKIEQLQSHI
jgi:hypothetical protein